MELIIKPTCKCNFNCKFCSAAYMNIITDKTEVSDNIKDYILKSNPTSIIVTGGEPLMMDPQYYYNLHNLSGTNISITSNLKDFYLNPSKWSDLFKEKWFGVATSFQYGDGRMWDSDTIYTEDMFVDVIKLFCDITRKKAPVFIAVIDENNESMAIEHVLLAKKLNTMTRLNNMIAVGKGTSYPRYKIFKIYLDIINKGLDMYEVNCSERNTRKCPRNIQFSCEQGIRSVYLGSNRELHVGVCDERLADGDEFESVDESLITMNKPYILSPDKYINQECVYCELFRLCNGCKINRLSAYNDNKYCEEMKRLKKDIIEKGWML